MKSLLLVCWTRKNIVSFARILLVIAVLGVAPITSYALQAPENRLENSEIPGIEAPELCGGDANCALYFNGSNQGVLVNQAGLFDTPSFTIESWISWSGNGTVIQSGPEGLLDTIPIISITRNLQADTAISLGINAASGTLAAYFLPADGPNTAFILGKTAITPNEWHHIAVTYDGQELSLYLDGNLDNIRKFDNPVLFQATGDTSVYMATSSSIDGAQSGYFQGQLDEVRLWETARTKSEIIDSANATEISDPNLIDYWQMNEGIGTSISSTIHEEGVAGSTINEPIWTKGAPMDLPTIITPDSGHSDVSTNSAPSLPSVISPTSGQTNVPLPVNLQVLASDPDGGSLTAKFYGRVAAQSGQDFSIIVLPDTQKYSINPDMDIFGIQTQWIVDQITERNIAFVTHLGDMVDDWNVPSQWNVVNLAMNKLESAGIPFGISPGNTDEDNYGIPPGTTYFNSYFPSSRFAGRSYYGGAYNGDNANSYELFSASGLNFIIIHLKYNLSYYPSESSSVLSWANNLLQTYSNRRAIVVTHYLTNTSDVFSTDGANIYNVLKGNSNLFLMLGGHLDTEGMRQDSGSDGHTIFSLRSDYQTRSNGGNGWLRILRFSPSQNKVFVSTYSPYLNQYETDANSQFSLNYAMNSNPFSLIGQTTVASGNTASTTWNNLQANTLYEWYVTVSDGSSTSTGSTWNFTTGANSMAPVITLQPSSQSVNENTIATFTSNASGNPSPTAQWQISTDGNSWSNINGATSTTYSFTARASDSGKRYRVVFTNSAGSANSNPVTLTVNTIPVILTNPVDITKNENETASFTSSASGSPTPTVQWQVSINGSTWSAITGATSTTLNFTALTADNGKYYRAVFTNIAGTISSASSILTVLSAPVISTQPSDLAISENHTATFSAAANGNPSPSIQWQTSPDGSTWSDIAGANTSSYSFSVTAADNGRLFRAVFSNSIGTTASRAATLAVLTLPVVTTDPTNQTVSANQTATFSAAASGNPAPTVQWQVSTNGSTWSNILGATSQTYSLTAKVTDNLKQYHAVFTNTGGSATSKAALLTVLSAPTVTSNPVSTSVIEGNAASFSSSADGNPTPSIQWQVSMDGTLWSNLSGATTNPLTFTVTATDQAKQYRAFFSNSTGSAISNSAILTVYTTPHLLTNPLSQVIVAGAQASFSASASGNPAPTVQWQVSSNGSTWVDVTGATGITLTFNASASDNGKQYHAVFTNLAGNVTSQPATLTVNTPPAVTTSPADLTVLENSMASFSASGSGSPAPTVQWQGSSDGIAWTNLTGATSSPYSFTTTIVDNGKKFRAVFTNVAGTAYSQFASLTVQWLPKITVNPANLTVNTNHSAVFTAEANANPTAIIQWQTSLDGNLWADITSANTSPLSFTASAADNGKKYRAVFTNTVGSGTSNAAILTVYYAPTVLLQPTNLTVLENQKATFISSADGNPSPTGQWQTSTDGISWVDLTGETSAAYNFYPTVQDNAKQYRVVFTNIIGKVTSNSAVIFVIKPPVVSLQPVAITAIEGQVVSFSASANGLPAPSIQWMVSADSTNWSEITGATTSTYSFTASAADSGKQFKAIFSNSGGSVESNPAGLTVYTKPIITLQPTAMTLVETQTASFSVSGTGTPAPAVQWQVSTDSGTSWNNINGAVVFGYSFVTTISDNNKLFRAILINAAGSVTSNTAKLTVMTDMIFADGFDSCNASAWKGGTVNSSRLSFNVTSGFLGTCGMSTSIVNSGLAYVSDTLPVAEKKYNVRFYFNKNTLKIGKNKYFTIYSAYNAQGTSIILAQVKYTGTAYQVRAGVMNNSKSWSYTTWKTISTGWHSLEIDWKAASSSTSGDGSLQFWIDSASQGTLSAINNDQHVVEKAALGAVQGLDSSMSGMMFFDSYVSKRLSFIGAENVMTLPFMLP